jgi:serine/threonine-protein kinase
VEGLVHRDVKPPNIFLSMQADRSTEVKLLDFGVAGLLESARSIEGDAGTLLGTPSYASPEQQRGERATPAMDVWSLGVLLFEMIAGSEPFGGTTIAQVVAAVQSDRRAPSILELAPNAPPRLAQLVSSMLEKDPSRRAPSMSHVVAELAAIQRRISPDPHASAEASGVVVNERDR